MSSETTRRAAEQAVVREALKRGWLTVADVAEARRQIEASSQPLLFALADRWSSIGPEPVTDPTGPSSGDLRVARGANWRYRPVGVSLSYRESRPASLAAESIGFRVAR